MNDRTLRIGQHWILWMWVIQTTRAPTRSSTQSAVPWWYDVSVWRLPLNKPLYSRTAPAVTYVIYNHFLISFDIHYVIWFLRYYWSVFHPRICKKYVLYSTYIFCKCIAQQCRRFYHNNIIVLTTYGCIDVSFTYHTIRLKPLDVFTNDITVKKARMCIRNLVSNFTTYLNE